MNLTEYTFNEQSKFAFNDKVKLAFFKYCLDVGLIMKVDIEERSSIIISLERIFLSINYSVALHDILNDEGRTFETEDKMKEAVKERLDKILEVFIKHLVDILPYFDLHKFIK